MGFLVSGKGVKLEFSHGDVCRAVHLGLQVLGFRLSV